MSQLKDITFVYERAEGYRIVPANGAIGGITPQGDFQLAFYVEAQLPATTRHELVDGKLGKELDSAQELRVVRELQSAVLMSREQAKSLAEFIERRLAEFEKVVAQKERDAEPRN